MTPPIDPERLTAGQRREEILTAAATVFGRRGYIGATTDQVARAAGISQPYVVRLFGTKEALFLEVVAAAKHALLDSFRGALTGLRAEGAGDDPAAITAVLGDRYVELAQDRGIHLPLMQAFVQGADPVVGAAARSGYLLIWQFLREEAGLDPVTARDFLAHGMLISVLLGLELPSHVDEDAAAWELLSVTCGDMITSVLPSEDNALPADAAHPSVSARRSGP